jgi:DNA-binding CsgD family transcriptional regulator
MGAYPDVVAGEHPDWRSVHAALSERDDRSLTAAELDTLAESLFWLDRPDDSMAVRGRAFAAHVDNGDHSGALMAAWQLFYDHSLVGEMALASGWLERARRYASDVEGTAAGGFLAVAEADCACLAGALDEAALAEALTHAERAVTIGHQHGDSDLMAMALQAKGRMLVALDRHEEGLAALDEAMVAVINGELSPLFTGWVFCNALSTCHDLADLTRGLQWSNAAMKWCADLPDGRLYPGICRVHVVELESLRGSWPEAAAHARLACEELTRHDPRYAGEAHYLIGELHRMTGELDLAEEAFVRGHHLGRVPQPGLARVRLAQGRVGPAVKALQLALDPAPAAPLQRAELLAALVDAQLTAGDRNAAQEAAGALESMVEEVSSDYLRALALVTTAAVLLATGDASRAHRAADGATATFRSLHLPYCEARAQTVRGAAAAALGERDVADLDLAAALATFSRLGAEPDARRVQAMLGEAPPSPLSNRETEVLRLVARGGTNKEIAAELVLSEHTVARHLSNIYTKLGVGSRSAATAFAYEHSLI